MDSKPIVTNRFFFIFVGSYQTNVKTWHMSTNSASYFFTFASWYKLVFVYCYL